jgi:hypothetical protein
MSGGSWMVGLIGIGVLIFLGRQVYLASLRRTEALQPWTWPQDLRATAEDMARLIDPTPKRILPPEEVVDHRAGRHHSGGPGTAHRR